MNANALESAPHRTPACPLCATPGPALEARFRERDYMLCHCCDLVFVPASQHLSYDAELRRYRQHRNSPDDPGYREFLDRLSRELEPRLHPADRGLDYGSGPGPTLALMLAERGFETAIYDPYFAADTGVLDKRYDFITCTETVEHFARPALEFERFDNLLHAGGWLGIMTGIRDPEINLTEWWYIRDETHVAFYSRRTMLWIAERHAWTPVFAAPTVVLFQKGGER